MTFNVSFSEIDCVISADVGEIKKVTEMIGGEPYTGEYQIVPRVTEQNMLTRNKLMTDNVIVKAIPYAEVSNTSNGITVTIGNDV